jgi:flagellar protein FlaI
MTVNINYSDEYKPLKSDNRLLLKDFYPVNKPYGYVGVEVLDDKGKMEYVSIEPHLSELESNILDEIKELIIKSMDVDLEVLDNPRLMREYLSEKVKKIFKKHSDEISEEAENKILYFLTRDFIGYGKIDVLMKDPFIEDISCNGYNTPIYIWHTIHESMPTKLQYASEEELSNVVTRLVYKTGHQISISQPILEGTLPEGYRAHVTLDEVSKRGDTFTIRKYRSNPFTLVDLINLGTVDSSLGAYLWSLVEYKRSLMISGAVASGKTALLNSVGMFIKPEMKTVSIEEVREIRLHENWIPMTARPSFQPGVKEISLFDLLKSALRQRPDYIIVGEVRGEETYTLFQSMAVGHGGLCSIHADSLDAVIKRLITKPMSIPVMMLPLMNVLVLIRRVKTGENVERRVDQIVELAPPESPDEPVELITRFKWNAPTDTFKYFEPKEDELNVFNQISEVYQVSLDKLYQDIERKKLVLDWMTNLGVEDYTEVSKIVRNYYLNQQEVYNLARMWDNR